MNPIALIQQILIYAIPILFAITVHEVAHEFQLLARRPRHQ